MPNPLAVIEQYLNQTDVKFDQVGDDAFVIPFTSRRFERIFVMASTSGGLIDLDAQIKVEENGIGEGSYQILRATFQTYMIKYTCDEDGDLFLVSRIPIELLDRYTLEGLVKGLAALADVDPRSFANATVMGRVAEQALSVLHAYRERSSAIREEPLAEAQLVNMAHKVGISAHQIGSSAFSLEGSTLQTKIAAECRGHYVSFRASFEDLRPRPDNEVFFREIAVANHRLGFTKLALDHEGRLCVMAEFPLLTLQAFTSGIEAISAGTDALDPLAALIQE